MSRELFFYFSILILATTVSSKNLKGSENTATLLPSEILELKALLCTKTDHDVKDRVDELEKKVIKNAEDIAHNIIIIDRQVNIY